MFQNIKTCEYLNRNSSTLFHSKNNKLVLLHLNIRSLNKNYDNLVEFSSTVPAQPHFILLTETKMKGDPFININLLGYNFLHFNSIFNAGGVGVYMLESLQFDVCSNIFRF